MDKSFIIHLGGINEEYRDDLVGNIKALFDNIVDFAQSVSVEEIEE